MSDINKHEGGEVEPFIVAHLDDYIAQLDAHATHYARRWLALAGMPDYEDGHAPRV